MVFVPKMKTAKDLPVKRLSFYLAGAKYNAAAHIAPILKVGDSVFLTPEPENEVDEQAIAVYWNRERLGYVPAEFNSHIGQEMRSGQRVSAHILELWARRPSWKRIKIQVAVWSN